MKPVAQDTVTALLADARTGDANAARRLFPIIYDQLHALARGQRKRARTADTLNTTALVHEAFIKLVRTEHIEFQDRAHFMAVAATAMRRILISYARRQTALKRWGGKIRLSLDDVERVLENEPDFGEAKATTLIVLDRALARLSQHADRQRRVVDCRFFGGMSIEETAVALQVSAATVKRDWSLAQAWLYRELEEELR